MMAVVDFRIFLIAGALAGVSGAVSAADLSSFDGSSWRIIAINGEATPATYTISFGGGMVTGRLGCNDFGGKLKVGEASLNISQLRATSRVCGDTAAAFEGEGFAVLSQPLRVSWASTGQPTIASALGSIALERLP